MISGVPQPELNINPLTDKSCKDIFYGSSSCITFMQSDLTANFFQLLMQKIPDGNNTRKRDPFINTSVCDNRGKTSGENSEPNLQNKDLFRSLFEGEGFDAPHIYSPPMQGLRNARASRLVVSMNVDSLGRMEVDVMKRGEKFYTRISCNDPLSQSILSAGLFQLEEKLLKMKIYPHEIRIINASGNRRESFFEIDEQQAPTTRRPPGKPGEIPGSLNYQV